MKIYNKLSKICKTEQNVNLKNLCSMHVGGIGKYICYPSTIKQVKKLIRYLTKHKIQHYIIGNGTNIIFEDSGYNGVLVSLKNLNEIKIKDNTLICLAGANLFAVNIFCRKNNLSGLEWSYGIPASVGGAVYMNAGAYGSEMKDVIKYVWALNKGKIVKYKLEQMNFSYRNSIFQQNSNIILKVEFLLNKDGSKNIEERQNNYFNQRKALQPYGTYNCGSVFKKTVDGSAGKTIDKLGLKNVKIGQIQISQKHANFFVNLGNGTSKDLRNLIDQTKQIVKDKTGLELEEEVIFVE